MRSDISRERLRELEDIIGYSFRDKKLLKKALSHPSYSSEAGLQRSESNQRLEFLGDAVLEAVISDYLYRVHPDLEEGELTRIRASLVFETALAVCARDLGLGEYLLLGIGEERSGGREKNSILSDAFEAVIGAIYIDGGIDQAAAFIHRSVISDIDELSLFRDSKSLIQEFVQKERGGTFRYETASLGGPDHMKRFKSELYIDDELVSSGTGQSKKTAEQAAAQAALRQLNIGK